MAVFASTGEPIELANRVVQAIKRGTIGAWELTSGHLRHLDPRGGRDAFFRITVTSSAVKFSLVGAKKTEPFDGAAYAYHHGRLTELLLGHFSDAVTRVQSTPFIGANGTSGGVTTA
jgi:hypothetical protein